MNSGPKERNVKGKSDKYQLVLNLDKKTFFPNRELEPSEFRYDPNYAV